MASRFWGGGAGNWNSTNTGNWAATSGGSLGSSAPVSGDDANFDGNADAGSGFTVTLTTTAPTIRNLTISGLDQAMILAGTPAWTIEGNISLPASNFTWSASGTVTLGGSSSSRTILTNGVTVNGGFTFNSSGSDWTLQSALTMGSNDNVILTAGDLDLAGFAVSCQTFSISGSTTRSLTMGAATVSVSNSGNAWNAGTTTNLTFDAGTSNIIMTRNTNAKTFVGGGLTYGTLSQGGSGPLTVEGANTFADIQNPYKATGATSIIFTAGTTQAVSAFTASGEAGRVLTLESSSAGVAATLSKSSGTVIVDYAIIKDITATGGATWIATNSTDGGGNTGWSFESGANVSVPASSIGLTVHAPTVSGGASVAVPLSTVALTTFAPSVGGGVRVQVPVSNITLQAFAPSVGSGVTVEVPLTTISLTAYAPTLAIIALSALPRVTLTGRFILAAT